MIYRFEGFELDADARLLSREGQALELPKRVFDCLLCCACWKSIPARSTATA